MTALAVHGGVEAGFHTAGTDVREGAGTIAVAVVLSQQVPDEVHVYYNTMPTIGPAATEPEDFTLPEGRRVEFAPYQQVAEIAIPIVNDDVQEETESFMLIVETVSSTSGVAIGPRQYHSVVIEDDDTPEVHFVGASANVTEDAGVVGVEMALSKVNTLPVTVQYRVGGTATAGADYQPLSGNVLFEVGQTQYCSFKT